MRFRWYGVAGLPDRYGRHWKSRRRDALAQAAQRAADDQSQARLDPLPDSTLPRRDVDEREPHAPGRTTCPPIVVWTKADLLADRAGVPGDVLLTSGATGEGLDTLRAAIARRLTSRPETRGDMVAVTAVRCRESLTHVRAHLQTARDCRRGGAGDELVASHLRDALDHLGQIVGAVYTDDLLDRIFSRFCIGK